MSDNKPNIEPQQMPVSGLITVLGELVRRLQSQPLIFGLGILLLLVIAGSLTIESLATLRIPALIIFVLGLLVWLVAEVRKMPSNSKLRSGGVNLRARDVGKSGKVTGIEGLPPSKDPPAVDLDAEHVEGDVAGARYDSTKEKGKDRK
jgi:hypothetical protein